MIFNNLRIYITMCIHIPMLICNPDKHTTNIDLINHFIFQGHFNLEYLPLKTGEVDGRLEFFHNDLGHYIYDLRFKGTPPGPERALYLRCPLGTNQTQTARFSNFYKQKTEYACSVSLFSYT